MVAALIGADGRWSAASVEDLIARIGNDGPGHLIMHDVTAVVVRRVA